MKRRLVASLFDYCVMLGWLAVLAAVFIPLHRAGFKPWAGHTDVVAFAASVLPVWLYLTLTEAGSAHATWGKRRIGLVVQEHGPGPAFPARIAVRNAVKLLPWELAHLGIAPLLAPASATTLVSPALAWIPITAAYVLVGVTIACAFIRRDHAALHDLVADTRVTAAYSPARAH